MGHLPYQLVQDFSHQQYFCRPEKKNCPKWPRNQKGPLRTKRFLGCFVGLQEGRGRKIRNFLKPQPSNPNKNTPSGVPKKWTNVGKTCDSKNLRCVFVGVWGYIRSISGWWNDEGSLIIEQPNDRVVCQFYSSLRILGPSNGGVGTCIAGVRVLKIGTFEGQDT